MPDHRSTIDLLARLRKRYRSPEYAFFEQVRSVTGFGKVRVADAVAMGLWPSRGMLLEGFEIKVTRGDWLRELRNPAKGEDVLGYCDLVWLVCADRCVAHEEELPPTWGLIVPRGDGLVTAVQAKRLTAKALSRAFFCSLMRNANAWLEQSISSAEVIQKARKAGGAEAEAASAVNLKYITSERDAAKETIKQFEKASGVTLHQWNGETIGEAVAFVLANRHMGIKGRLEDTRRAIDDALQRLEAKDGD